MYLHRIIAALNAIFMEKISLSLDILLRYLYCYSVLSQHIGRRQTLNKISILPNLIPRLTHFTHKSMWDFIHAPCTFSALGLLIPMHRDDQCLRELATGFDRSQVMVGELIIRTLKSYIVHRSDILIECNRTFHMYVKQCLRSTTICNYHGNSPSSCFINYSIIYPRHEKVLISGHYQI